MTASINLISDPWIRVRFGDGTLREVGILEAFESAPEISGIRGEIASQDAAILRLLLAILHSALRGPETVEDWAAARDNPRWTISEVAGYLENVSDRFELCGGSAPFFQVAGLTTTKQIPSSLDALIADVPNGSKLFTSRLAEGIERINWAEGARWLIHAHAFDPSGIRTGAVGDPRVKGGKGYPQGTGWGGQLGLVIIQGSSLFETLMLNLVVAGERNELEPVYVGEDLPPWERPPLGPGVEGTDSREPTGPVDCYTWQGRRVRLVGDDEWVTGVFLCQGDRATPQNRTAVEPMTAWRYSEPQTKKLGATVYMPRKHHPDRAFWRGLTGVISQDAGSNTGKDIPQWRIPANVAFYQYLMERHLVPEGILIPIKAVGIEYGSQEATVQELIDDLLLVPSSVLDANNPAVELMVRDCIEAADRVSAHIRNLASNLARAAGNDLADGAREDAGARFYRMVDRPFRNWLTLVTNDTTAIKKKWMQELRDLAESLAAEMIDQTPSSAFAGRADGAKHIDAGLAEAWFRSGLRRSIPLAFSDSTGLEQEGERN